MIALPRRIRLIFGWMAAALIIASAILQIRAQPTPGLSILACTVCVAVHYWLFTDRDPDRMPLVKSVLGTAGGCAIVLLATDALDPARDTYRSGGWYVTAIACIAVTLHWHRRRAFAWLLLGFLTVHLLLWAGPQGVIAFAVPTTVLLVLVLVGGAWAVERTAEDMRKFSAAERTAAEYRAVQDAYHFERELRLGTTSRLALPMLQRIADAGGRVDPADRAECRVLEQTIRDEIRGGRLLNDALRDQIIAHRRNGAVVQVNDDGGIDDIDPALIDPMLTRIAEAIDGLQSDRIIIRTASADSPKALSVVATSTDPVAAALGLDDGDDTVDLWLEFDRPGAVV